MSTADGSQIDIPAGSGYVDSIAAVWDGLETTSAELLQTGYSLDATNPSYSNCAGFANSCDYGLWWEDLISNPDSPPQPYSGDPRVAVGNILQMSVDYSSPGDYVVEIDDTSTGGFWHCAVSTGNWAPTLAPFSVEAFATASSTTSAGAWPSQIADFGSEPISFEYGELSTCSCGTLLPVSTAEANGWYGSYQMDQGAGVSNTEENWVTGSGYFGGGSSWSQVAWSTSEYSVCPMAADNTPPEYTADPHCYSGGGGGCVAYDTPILTAYGYVPVQALTPGEVIEEYNFTSEGLTRGELLSANASVSNELVDVNHGLMSLTATDQPIFIRNGTFEGWLHDPRNITTSDYLFDPVTLTWIHVNSVQISGRSTTVYDVVTSGENDFVANGVLLDLK
jgi:hypothetical protein